MDNVTHTLCGLALARCGLDRKSPLATPVLAIAANLPDIDHLWSLGGLRYHLHHRGVTHSLLGVAVESALLGGGAFAIARRRQLAGASLAWLVLAATVGCLSHIALDGLNNYGIRPWWPFSSERLFGDAAFIVDPWLWLLLGAAAFLGVHRRGVGRVWPLFGGLSLAVVLSGAPETTPQPGVAAVYLLGMLAVLALDRSAEAIGRTRLARAATLLAVLYVGGLAATSAVVLERGRAFVATELAPGVALGTSSVTPWRGVPWRGHALVEAGDTIFAADVDVLRGTIAPVWTLRRNLADPALAAIEGTPELEAWRVFARHPFVAHVGSETLVLGDARYDIHPRASWCNIEVPIPRR